MKISEPERFMQDYQSVQNEVMNLSEKMEEKSKLLQQTEKKIKIREDEV